MLTTLLKELKYTTAYCIPITCFMGFFFGGWLSWLTVIFSFVITPLMDLLLPTSSEVSDPNNKTYSRVYDWFLYINVIWVYGLVFFAGYQLMHNNYSTTELIGLLLGLGLVLGTSGINVAHELGHRNNKKEQLMAQSLLLPSFYMHFYIEHNRGHHYHVATPLDPATAQKGEYLYLFWLKSIFLSYIDSWKIQFKILKGDWLSWKNNMLWYLVLSLGYISVLFMLFGFKITVLLIISGIIGILLLETINYIEHYGLERKQLDNGHYERVQPCHSWNANYTFGRIILFELTRHSDHHYKASKKYHTLAHQKHAPELPFGYPAAIICSLVPWLWFAIMHPKLKT
ncbi:alkane 1-monooxygenase [Flammeovirga sp. SubArs3]|uniref:alkane 1-monooxygenase n=1 Tax=Flammeovirga sp. SubArs3 TaxID=2995316 RepID=UPI00248C6383|nr:alkane 1-monooxygenase [Flammeovirga sp. SubArs3]